MKKTWIISLAVAILYLPINIAAIYLPSIPGLEVFILWGLVLPILSMVTHWVWLAKKRAVLPFWWQTATIATLVYGVCGVATIHTIGMMWASI